MTRVLGIILIAVGLIGIVWGGIQYTTRQNVADIGPIHISDEKKHSIPLPPVAGAVALVAGVVLMVAGKQ